MKSFFDWFEEQKIAPTSPWLVLGKGPSFSKRIGYDLSQYLLLSLNHAVREQRVTVAHIIDLDVVEHLGEVLAQNADYVVMPWHPHVKNRPSSLSLDQLVEEQPVLRGLREAGRLLWYNLSNSQPRAGSPVVNVRYFSAEAAINLLATAGVTTVRSLGIDGGATYSTAFDDLKEKTLLANSRTSFDQQFGEIAKTILRTGIDYAPLDLESPIRVFVATTEAQMLAVKVLEYSIKKHTSMSSVVIPMHRSGLDMPLPADPKNHPRTPFSFQRFTIPELMKWTGRAIYLDSDMQVFQDLRAVWTLPFDGAQLLAVQEPDETGRRPQFSVMLLDCASLSWRIADIVRDLDQGRLTYESLMYQMAVAERIVRPIDPIWNSLERYERDRTALIHYTDMNTQPWVSLENPNGYLWVRDLRAAIESGFLDVAYVEEHVRLGYVRPSLLWQLTNGVDDPLTLPRDAVSLDRNYKAPYLGLPKHSATPWKEGALPQRVLRRGVGAGGWVMRAIRRWGARVERTTERLVHRAKPPLKRLGVHYLLAAIRRRP